MQPLRHSGLRSKPNAWSTPGPRGHLDPLECHLFAGAFDTADFGATLQLADVAPRRRARGAVDLFPCAKVD